MVNSLPAEPQGSPKILEWVAYPFTSRSSQPEIKLRSPEFQVDSLPAELPGNPYGQLMDKRGKNIQWRKDSLFNKWYQEKQTATCKKERKKETRIFSNTIYKNKPKMD